MNLNELVTKYVQLRAKKDDMKAAYELKVAAVDQVLSQIEGVIMKTFSEQNIDSVKTQAGTAYRSTRVLAGIADWNTFVDFVKANDAYDMLYKRCNTAVISQYKEVNNDVPPGVNWKEEHVINIRRAKEAI